MADSGTETPPFSCARTSTASANTLRPAMHPDVNTQHVKPHAAQPVRAREPTGSTAEQERGKTDSVLAASDNAGDPLVVQELFGGLARGRVFLEAFEQEVTQRRRDALGQRR
eukprot:2585863-Rhodomonas_salina.1